MRSGGGFRMILDRKDRQGFVSQPGDCVVVEVDMRHLNFSGKGVGVDSEAVIVRCDLDLSGSQILDRLIAAAMTEFEFVRFAAECRTDQLMAKTDAEYRGLSFGELLDLFDDRFHR